VSGIANEDMCYHYRPDIIVPLEAVELGNGLGAAAAALTNVPDLDAALAAGVDVLGRIRDRHGADHLTVSERVYLARVTRYPGCRESIGRERHRLHLTFARYVETIRTATGKEHTHTRDAQSVYTRYQMVEDEGERAKELTACRQEEHRVVQAVPSYWHEDRRAAEEAVWRGSR